MDHHNKLLQFVIAALLLIGLLLFFICIRPSTDSSRSKRKDFHLKHSVCEPKLDVDANNDDHFYWSRLVQQLKSISNDSIPISSIDSILFQFYNTNILDQDEPIKYLDTKIEIDYIKQAEVNQALGEYNYWINNDLQSSLEYFQKSHALYCKLNQSDYLNFWNIQRLSEIHMLLRQNYKALNYANNLIEFAQVHNMDDIHKAYALTVKGYLLFRFRLYDQSNKHNYDALKLLSSESCSPIKQKAYKGLLLSSLLQDHTDDQRFFVLLNKAKESIEECDRDYINIDRFEGQYYYLNQEYVKAESLVRSSIRFLENEQNLDIPVFTNQCYYLSDIYLKLGQYEKSLATLQSSDLRKWSDSYNFDLYKNNAYKDNIFSFGTMIVSSKVYFNQYLVTKNLSFLEKAKLLFLNAISNLELDNSLMYEEEYIRYLVNKNEIYDLGVQIMAEYYEQESNTAHLEKLLNYAEQAKYSLFFKNYILHNQFQSKNNYKSHIALNSELNQLIIEGFNDDDRLSQLISQIDSYNIQIDTSSFNIDINSKIPSIGDINQYKQKHKKDIIYLIQIDTIGYFIHLSEDKDTLHKKVITQELKSDILDYNKSLTNKAYTDVTAFSSKSSNIYDSLFRDIFDNTTSNEVLIIQDPDFNIESLGALITNNNKTSNAFSELPYLSLDHTFSYSPSLRFLLESQNDNNNQSNQIAAFSYSSDATIEKCEEYPIELAYSFKEVNQIKKSNHTSKLYTGEDNTIEHFKHELKQPGILHLATHSNFVNDVRDNVYLYFRNGQCGIDSLYGFQLLNFENNKDLIILSSCDSGTGLEEINEEIFSLSNYLLACGADHVIANYWKANDYANFEFFDEFYKQLNSDDYNEAFKAAKSKLISSPILSHPYYWAGIRKYN